MRLTIKNYKNIIGSYISGHSIVNVVELPDCYSFTVRSKTGGYGDVFVKRDGRKDQDGDWIYHFGHGSHNTQSVTPGWFGNMANAVTAIISEYETL
jgi:hypothetical protein